MGGWVLGFEVQGSGFTVEAVAHKIQSVEFSAVILPQPTHLLQGLGLQGHLAHKKHSPPGTLQQNYI